MRVGADGDWRSRVLVQLLLAAGWVGSLRCRRRLDSTG